MFSSDFYLYLNPQPTKQRWWCVVSLSYMIPSFQRLACRNTDGVCMHAHSVLIVPVCTFHPLLPVKIDTYIFLLLLFLNLCSEANTLFGHIMRWTLPTLLAPLQYSRGLMRYLKTLLYFAPFPITFIPACVCCCTFWWYAMKRLSLEKDFTIVNRSSSTSVTFENVWLSHSITLFIIVQDSNRYQGTPSSDPSGNRS